MSEKQSLRQTGLTGVVSQRGTLSPCVPLMLKITTSGHKRVVHNNLSLKNTPPPQQKITAEMDGHQTDVFGRI